MPKRIGYEVIGEANPELLFQLQQEEGVRINLEALVEQKWWSSKAVHNESEALASGELIIVPEAGENYSLRWGLIQNQEPRTVSQKAYQLLLEIQSRWQRMMMAQGEDITDIYLAVVSLYRSQELQERLIAKTHMASKGVSSHTVGMAIDFDPNGYYWAESRDPINYKMTDYRDIYSRTLITVLEGLMAEGSCNVIWEKGFKIEGESIFKYTACYHVCVSPDFG